MDAANRRPQLPALTYLDIDKTKTEEDPYQYRTSGAQQTYNGISATSPSHQHPPGPSPYSHPPSQQANSWHTAKTGVHTPPESRRSSGEPYENNKLNTRQSLPSISEALGVESQTFSAAAPTSQPPSLPAPYSHEQSAVPSSPSLTAKRSSGMETSRAHHSHVNGSTYPYTSFRQDSAGPQSYPPSETSTPAFAPAHDSRPPPLHLQTSQSTPQTHHSERYAPSQATSPPYAQTSQSSGSMAPPSFPYGYTPYPPRYAQQTPSSTQSTGPIYQPSSSHAAPHTPTSSWRSEGTPRIGTDDRSATYSESVKRHLDLYDLEAALNEIAATSGGVLDFSRRYGDKMHQLARTTPSPSALPSMVEVEDMIAKSKIQIDSLNKIREVIVDQQVAYEQQMADQRQQHKTLYEQAPPPPELSRVSEDEKGGFAGADTKKRRGRAAPPGRCHSCNRAETPEWRRGPDGARTLCNACGLHYAKLTRKQTGGNKAVAGSSNLRPKEA